MSLRVAMIIQGYHPRVGGAERQLMALVPLLQARGAEIHILTRRYAGLKPFEMIGGVPVHRLPIPGPKAIASMSFTLAALPLLLKLRPDVIHAHELLSPTTTAVAAKRLLRTPVAAKVLRGGTLGDLAKLQRKPLGQRRIATFRQQVDAFITISQEIDEELAAVGVPQGKRPFIPNGVDMTRFNPVDAATKQALRTQLGLPDGLTAVFTGRLAAEKRVDQLIALWPEVRAAQPQANLLLVGTGEEEDKLKAAAGEGVHFAGRTEDVTPYLQAADLFILPSATEGLSNALLEALAVGLPAIATNVGGAPDVIQHDHSGWLIPPDQPETLRQAILTLLADENRRAKLGQNGRLTIQQNYALSHTADRLFALYQQLCDPQAAILETS